MLRALVRIQQICERWAVAAQASCPATPTPTHLPGIAAISNVSPAPSPLSCPTTNIRHAPSLPVLTFAGVLRQRHASHHQCPANSTLKNAALSNLKCLQEFCDSGTLAKASGAWQPANEDDAQMLKRLVLLQDVAQGLR